MILKAMASLTITYAIKDCSIMRYTNIPIV